MSRIATRGPLGLKPDKAAPKPRTQMRRVAKGKKSSSVCPIMRSAKGEPCLADWCGCGGSTTTTCLRHIRKFKIGGAGQKTPNHIGFYGCQVAEDMFEKSKDQQWTWRGVCQALVLTQMRLLSKGLMPPREDVSGSWM